MQTIFSVFSTITRNIFQKCLSKDMKGNISHNEMEQSVRKTESTKLTHNKKKIKLKKSKK